MITIFAIIIVGVAIDFGYSTYVANRLAKWESTIERDANGVQKGCEAFETGDLNSPTAILFVHGLNDSANCFRFMAPELAKSGYCCRVMRLPGFGESTEEYGRYEAGDWIDAVDKEVSQLKSKHKRVFVVAHSLGGATAIAFLLQKRNPIDGIALLAPAIETSNKRSPLLSARFFHDLGNWILIFTKTLESPYDNDCNDPDGRNPSDKIRYVKRNTIGQLYELIEVNRGKANQLELPVLMVLPGDDKIVDNDASRKYFEDIKTENKKLKVQTKARHSIPYDFGWQEVALWIDEFIKSVPVAK